MDSLKVILIALSALVVAFDGPSIKPCKTFFRISLYVVSYEVVQLFYVNLYLSIKMDSVRLIYFLFSIKRAALLGHLISKPAERYLSHNFVPYANINVL